MKIKENEFFAEKFTTDVGGTDTKIAIDWQIKWKIFICSNNQFLSK